MKTSPLLLLFAIASPLLAFSASGQSQSVVTPTIVYKFTGPDGAGPSALIQGSDGNFYGTTAGGGFYNSGTVFKLSAAGTLTTLYNFGERSHDGFGPCSLIQASDGDLYGTTYEGGAGDDFGTVFRLSTTPGRAQILHSFMDGSYLGLPFDDDYPYSTLIEGLDGSLYGTTFGIGGDTYVGSVYKLDRTREFTTVYNFDEANRVAPYASLARGNDGNFYGIGYADLGRGKIFKITPDGALTTFVDLTDENGPANIDTTLLLASDGNFYGISTQGRIYGNGTFFRLTSTGTLTVLHHFTKSENEGSSTNLIQAGDGNFYGGTPAITFTTSDGSRDSTGGTLFRITPDGTPTTLYTFPAHLAGASPSALIRAKDGRYYGTTKGSFEDDGTVTGHSFGYGTVFVVNVVSPPGTLAFASGTANVAETAGSVALPLTRTGGSEGVVSVNVATADGTAIDGTDYTGISTTVSWADNDAADKTVVVPILNPGAFDGGTRSFIVTLTDATGGAAAGSPQTVSILDNDAVPQPTVQLTSPPVNAALFSRVPLTVAAAVNDPGGILSTVDYFLNGDPLKNTVARGSFALDTVTPGPGTYVIKAVATDIHGRMSTSTRTITVVDAGTDDPAPAAVFLGGLNGHKLAGGDTITLAASAKSLRADGGPLAEVSFYAGDELIASFDGGGNVIANGRNQPANGRRQAAAATPAAAGSVFSTSWTVPNEDKSINLIVLAKTTGGVSQISIPVTVTATATSATSNHAPVAFLTGVVPGEAVATGTTFSVQAQVSDPDAVSGIPATNDLLRTGARRRNAATASGRRISKVNFYLDSTRVETRTAAPYGADIALFSPGAHVLQAIATDDAGLSGVADPVIIQAVETPTVTLSVPGASSHSTTVLEGGHVLKAHAVRTGSDLSQPLTVAYKVKGANVPGVDYRRLSGTVTIPANSSSARIKIKVLDDGVADGNKTLKLRLVPSASGSYKLGTPAQIKVRVIDVESVR